MKANGVWIEGKTVSAILGRRNEYDGARQLDGLETAQRTNREGKPGRRKLWRREDVELVARVQREARLHLSEAVRVVVAMRSGRL